LTWTVIRFLHVGALIFFVGGQLALALAVVPAMRRHGAHEAMRAIARRFGVASAVAIAVVIATGVAMASRYSLWGAPVLPSGSPTDETLGRADPWPARSSTEAAHPRRAAREGLAEPAFSTSPRRLRGREPMSLSRAPGRGMLVTLRRPLRPSDAAVTVLAA
jgi:hypothetical protein